jgi:hypothetical protein
VGVSLYPPLVKRQWLSNLVYRTTEIVGSMFSVWYISHQKMGIHFLPDLLIYCLMFNFKGEHTIPR